MKNPRAFVSRDMWQLDELIKHSCAEDHPVIAGFVQAAHSGINAELRSTAPRTALTRHFLDELRQMQDYAGVSYRVSHITDEGLAALQRGRRQLFSDSGVQSASVAPRHFAVWVRMQTGRHARSGLHLLFSIFDETVPQKNLSTRMLADHVAVPLDTPLRLSGLRIDGGHIVAHFRGAGRVDGPVRDIYSGSLHA